METKKSKMHSKLHFGLTRDVIPLVHFSNTFSRDLKKLAALLTSKKAA